MLLPRRRPLDAGDPFRAPGGPTPCGPGGLGDEWPDMALINAVFGDPRARPPDPGDGVNGAAQESPSGGRPVSGAEEGEREKTVVWLQLPNSSIHYRVVSVLLPSVGKQLHRSASSASLFRSDECSTPSVMSTGKPIHTGAGTLVAATGKSRSTAAASPFSSLVKMPAFEFIADNIYDDPIGISLAVEGKQTMELLQELSGGPSGITVEEPTVPGAASGRRSTGVVVDRQEREYSDWSSAHPWSDRSDPRRSDSSGTPKPPLAPSAPVAVTSTALSPATIPGPPLAPAPSNLSGGGLLTPSVGGITAVPVMISTSTFPSAGPPRVTVLNEKAHNAQTASIIQRLENLIPKVMEVVLDPEQQQQVILSLKTARNIVERQKV